MCPHYDCSNSIWATLSRIVSRSLPLTVSAVEFHSSGYIILALGYWQSRREQPAETVAPQNYPLLLVRLLLKHDGFDGFRGELPFFRHPSHALGLSMRWCALLQFHTFPYVSLLEARDI